MQSSRIVFGFESVVDQAFLFNILFNRSGVMDVNRDSQYVVIIKNNKIDDMDSLTGDILVRFTGSDTGLSDYIGKRSYCVCK